VLDLRPDAVPVRAPQRDIQPTGEERTFSPDELIVSKTDPRGVITYANDVFLRVSRYSRSEVVGKPHNIIRHPEMPKAVYKLLWDTLARKREIFAYINNLAADGAHYWVLAHVTPSYGYDGSVIGYHSNRRSPSPAAVEQMAPLYEELLAEERRHANGREAVEASSALFERLVAERAESYERFIWTVIGSEEI
jgi:PAS domain S-box-containing protein